MWQKHMYAQTYMERHCKHKKVRYAAWGFMRCVKIYKLWLG